MSVIVSNFVAGELTTIDLNAHCKGLTVMSIIKTKPPSLIYYRKNAKSVDNLRKTIAQFLIKMCNWFDHKVTNVHAIDIADRLLTKRELNSLSFEDLYLISEELKSQKTFGKLTPAGLLQVIERYAKDKKQQILAHNKELHFATKDDPGLADRIRQRGVVKHLESTITKKVAERRIWNKKHLE